MNIEDIKSQIVVNIYNIPSDKKVPLHKHDKHYEIFYCIKGDGFGVLEDGEIELAAGKVFNVPAGVLHSLRSDSELYVASFLIPVIGGK
ncbi:MAG: cupin domain-containing protein [Bacillota bacterium]